MINLLQKKHDFITQRFIDGFISYEIFEMLEEKFIKDSKLFTVCTN